MNRWFQTLEFGPTGQRTNRTDSSGLWIDWGRTSGVSLKLWPILADLIKLNEDAGAAKRTIRRGPHKASNSLGPWRRRVAWYRQVRNPCEDAFCSTNNRKQRSKQTGSPDLEPPKPGFIWNPNPDQLHFIMKYKFWFQSVEICRCTIDINVLTSFETRLYERVCRSVGPSVNGSVGP